ncbi:MAG: VWA domain-containing protein [Acidobacteria bacterium]|nr:VWA domain-containing protein [Acidobacteriota bacterium]
MRLFASLCTATLLLAQESAAPTIRINVNLIQIDATVTDKQGKHVPNLTAADFELLQDGKRQTITDVLWVHPGTLAAPRRTLAILVDDLSLSARSLADTRDALRNLINTKLGPQDVVSVGQVSNGDALLQRFTSDKRQLLAMVDRLSLRGRHGAASIAPLEGGGEQAGDPTLAGLARAQFAREESAMNTRKEINARVFLATAQHLVRGLRELPGRKSLILFAEQLALSAASDAPSALSTDRTLTTIRELADWANRSSVVLYPIDPRGTANAMLSAADDMPAVVGRRGMGRIAPREQSYLDSQYGHSLLAEQTGGLASLNRNDLPEALATAVSDQEGYYILSYRPDDQTFVQSKQGPKFHRTEVKLRPAGLRVRYRHGIVGADDAQRIPPPASPLEAALLSPLRATALPFRLTPLLLRQPDGTAFVRALLHLNVQPLDFREAPAAKDDPDQSPWYEANVVMAVFLYDDNGDAVQKVSRSQRIRARGPALDSIQSHGLMQQLELPIPRPGPYQLRAALVDTSTQKAGSASRFLEAPDWASGHLALSDIVLSGQSGPALRQLNAGEQFSYSAAVYNGGPALVSQISIYRQGKLIHRGEPTNRSKPQIEGALALDPGAAIGAPKSRQFALRQIDFTIR